MPIVLPLKWWQIIQFIPASERDRLDMVDFPSILLYLPVFLPFHTCTAFIFSINSQPRLRRSSSPNRFYGLFIKSASVSSCAWLSHNTPSLLVVIAIQGQFADWLMALAAIVEQKLELIKANLFYFMFYFSLAIYFKVLKIRPR